MKSKIVCIFAHPDDEAFGPGGTIATFAKTQEVYLICATKGEAGNKMGKSNLANIRVKELKASAKILGIRRVFILNFKDGSLSNSTYHKLAKQIKKIIETIHPETLLTFEPKGISGHIDHIAVSMVTTFIFYKIPYLKKLFYYCHIRQQVKLILKIIGDYFIYFPPGYDPSQVNRTVRVKGVWKQRINAILAHRSQMADTKKILSFLDQTPQLEHFLVLKK